MTSSRPYLVRAIHDWIVDNGLTPNLVVDAQVEGVRVPGEYVHEGKIVLNVAARAVRGLALGNDVVEFDARFGGRPFAVSVPMRAVLAVYAAENGVGMAFHDDGDGDGPPSPGGEGREGERGRARAGRPGLRVVK